MNYDEYITGLYDPTSPMNQKEVAPEPIHTWGNLTEAYASGHEQVFKDKQSEILNQLYELRYILESVESGLVNRVSEIIKQVK